MTEECPIFLCPSCQNFDGKTKETRDKEFEFYSLWNCSENWFDVTAVRCPSYTPKIDTVTTRAMGEIFTPAEIYAFGYLAAKLDEHCFQTKQRNCDHLSDEEFRKTPCKDCPMSIGGVGHDCLRTIAEYMKHIYKRREHHD